MTDIKYTGRACARNRRTCDTTCVLCVYVPAQPSTVALPSDLSAPEYFVIYCGCQVVEVRPCLPGAERGPDNPYT